MCTYIGVVLPLLFRLLLLVGCLAFFSTSMALFPLLRRLLLDFVSFVEKASELDFCSSVEKASGLDLFSSVEQVSCSFSVFEQL